MDSNPFGYPTRAVTDWLFAFSNGRELTIAIGEGDCVDLDNENFTIKVSAVDPVTKLVGVTTIERSNLLFRSVNPRIEVIYPPGESPLEKVFAEREAALKPRSHATP